MKNLIDVDEIIRNKECYHNHQCDNKDHDHDPDDKDKLRGHNEIDLFIIQERIRKNILKKIKP